MYLQATSAASLLDIPVSTFYQLVRQGTLPPAVSKLGKHRLWRKADLVATVDPAGYKSAHDKAEAAAGHPPASQRKRPGPLLLAPGPGHAKRGTARAPAGRSPYAGILGGAGSGAAAVTHTDGREDDSRHG